MHTINENEYKKLSNLIADFHTEKAKLYVEEIKDYSIESYKLDNNLYNLKKILTLYGYELVSMMVFENYATVLHTETDMFYNIHIEYN